MTGKKDGKKPATSTPASAQKGTQSGKKR